MDTHQRQLRIVLTIERTRHRAMAVKDAFSPNSEHHKAFSGGFSFSFVSVICHVQSPQKNIVTHGVDVVQKYLSSVSPPVLKWLVPLHK